MDAVTTVMTDPLPAATCGCGCGRPRPAPPAGGGLAPVYASRACQQRAYRQRQAARPAPAAVPVDPPSVAALIRDIRELAGVLDAGGTVPDGLTGAVRAGVRDLLARVSPTPPASRPAEDQVPAGDTGRAEVPPRAPAVPTPETRSSRDDRQVVPARSRRRAPRPVVVRGETGDHPLSAELSAAVRAVHAAGPDDQPVLTAAEGGLVTVTLGGVLLGTVGRAPYGHRGWQARNVAGGGGGVVRVWRAGRMQDTHPTRKDAVQALAYALALLADRARRATLRTT
ncbi:hypothetical protein [Frankia sp. AgB32]|uniref:hypothetical protein n=1 Tax=Frankia sp. AgB32 TaxID=631119 RepID=UPI00200C0E8D|nr:hypothetical protein [Frankia sp. AgB32]